MLLLTQVAGVSSDRIYYLARWSVLGGTRGLEVPRENVEYRERGLHSNELTKQSASMSC